MTVIETSKLLLECADWHIQRAKWIAMNWVDGDGEGELGEQWHLEVADAL